MARRVEIIASNLDGVEQAIIAELNVIVGKELLSLEQEYEKQVSILMRGFMHRLATTVMTVPDTPDLDEFSPDPWAPLNKKYARWKINKGRSWFFYQNTETTMNKVSSLSSEAVFGKPRVEILSGRLSEGSVDRDTRVDRFRLPGGTIDSSTGQKVGGRFVKVSEIGRFMDRLGNNLKKYIQQINARAIIQPFPEPRSSGIDPISGFGTDVKINKAANDPLIRLMSDRTGIPTYKLQSPNRRIQQKSGTKPRDYIAHYMAWWMKYRVLGRL